MKTKKPIMKTKKPIIRIPKGSEWVRVPDAPVGFTHLLYHGLLWGYVYKPYAIRGDKSKWRWFTENLKGAIERGRTKEEAQRRLARTLFAELKNTKVRFGG